MARHHRGATDAIYRGKPHLQPLQRGQHPHTFGLYSGVKNRRLQGDLLAIGAKYGYSWMLGRDWRLEAEAGIAVGYAWYKEYDCATCGTFYGKDGRLFLLPLLGINISYMIDWKNK